MKKLTVFFCCFLILVSGTKAFTAAGKFPDKPLSFLHQDYVSDPPVETRPFQLSLVPMIGTEGRYTQDYIYNFSLNIFGGLTGGVDGLELGGFLNMNRYSMTGIQGSGFGNVVNGNTRGVQMAGFFNVNNSFSEGLQAAGFVNVVNGGARLMQASGFVNVINGNSRLLQGAGFGNIVNGNMDGIQAAGFANINSGNTSGIQVAGFGNVAGGKVAGIQAAGFGNIAPEVEGIQMAGFLNVAGTVKGIQLGFINVADSIDGIPVGFLSIVRDGYRKLEISAGDAMNLNFGFKIGVRRFYNIFSIGTQFTGPESTFAYGYGIGSEFYRPDNRYLNIEILSHRFAEERWWSHDRVNMLNQLRVSFSRDMNERWQIFGGPVLNFHVSWDRENDRGALDIAPYDLFSFSGQHTDTKVWFGINAGFRFW